MKRVILYFSLIVLLSSCNALRDIFASPVDRPGSMLNTFIFQENYDTLQLKTDEFVKNNIGIKRHFNGTGYDKGEHRIYRMRCDNDTLEFNIVFAGNDTLSRMSVSYFKIRNIAFKSSDYSERKKLINENRAFYDICQACYEKQFLAPLKKITKANK